MTLHRKTIADGKPVFAPVSDQEEATIRAAVVPDGSSGPLLFNDSGFDCVHSDQEATAIRAEWSATAAAKAALVPPSVLPRQFRLALSQAGLRASVESAVAAADQATKDTWEYANSIERNHPMLLSMATALGVSGAQLDNLFRAAAKL